MFAPPPFCLFRNVSAIYRRTWTYLRRLKSFSATGTHSVCDCVQSGSKRLEHQWSAAYNPTTGWTIGGIAGESICRTVCLWFQGV